MNGNIKIVNGKVVAEFQKVGMIFNTKYILVFEPDKAKEFAEELHRAGTTILADQHLTEILAARSKNEKRS